MGVWSVAIVDSGVTDETEARFGPNLFEYDYYYRNGNTDGARSTSHGSIVAESVEHTNGALERVDFQVSSNSEYFISSYAIRNALAQIGDMHDSGWHIGSYNLSIASSYSSFTSPFRAQIDALADRGIFGVAASGNGGTSGALEAAAYPARLSNVISVGSHDGAGNPSTFSQNHPSTVHILADGEDFPGAGYSGTSFAAPQVAATVTTVQALVEGVKGDRLSFGQIIDTLQLGGAGPRSAVDPADGATTYFLHTHSGSVDYAIATHIDPSFSGLEYIASFSDLEAAFGRDAGAARTHYLSTGVYEGRTVEFDGLEYVASHPDLIGAFGTDREAAAFHYLEAGRWEGRLTNFDADNYMSANPDLAAAFGGDDDLATQHYITNGFFEGRSTGELTGPSMGPAQFRAGISEGATDLPYATNSPGYVGIGEAVVGTISFFQDADVFRTELTAGETITIAARGSSSGGGTLHDIRLFLFDPDINQVGSDYDSGQGLDALLVYTPTTSGTHYIGIDGKLIYQGTYTIEVSRGASAVLTGLTEETVPVDAVEDAPSPTSDDVQLTTLGPEPLYTDWIV
ncbi:S8 family serine peptidase [Nisaea acidiphila]|uniref:S8 family serine peptidase n=1 Tax=Nisaea acidiphila TaxID=1862145 RepID=A0A9J7AW60_9PROT|nr:S8 family serine peptidase [Nisaea acidiphila]UUX51591.1 S8 family serine peptidase [Nisaea acidiphila]